MSDTLQNIGINKNKQKGLRNDLLISVTIIFICLITELSFAIKSLRERLNLTFR